LVDITFPEPYEIAGYWDWDKIHAPKPLTLLAGDAVVNSMGEGFTIAQHGFGSVLALRCRMVNYYFYSSFPPDDTFTPPTRDMDEYSRRLEAFAFKIGERWTTEWEPELIAMLQRARTTDYAAMSDQELQAALEEYLGNLVYMWTIHGWINLSLVPATALTDFYNQEVQPADPNEAWLLLQGYPTKSVEASAGLWQLSRTVRSSPVLSTLFEQSDPRAILQVVEQSEDGSCKSFAADLRAYLDEYGWRSDGIYEIGEPTWREEPSIPLNTIQGYMRMGDENDPRLSLERARARREELTRSAREKLAADGSKLARFDELMEAAKYNTRVTEDHSFWIDQMGIAAFRELCLHVGARLAAKGVLEQPDEVFFLYVEELRDALKSSTPRTQVVRERRAEMQAAAAVVPPFHLGEPTPANPDPFFVALVDKMLGLLPVEPSTDPSIITGVAASPGTVQGTARVVRALVEASKLQQGDIMVCEMTVPPWVPLFATVSGVVADSGGILSHCAIVAREFGLPAVVGTRVGTATIEDGMTITVDGTRGVVRIDARPNRSGV
jgi:phosphohistidine swiveling domain-containing protein